MKKFKKFLTVFLAIVMCVSSPMSVNAENSSGGGTTSSLTTDGETSSLTTPYGEIPETYASAEDYPFVSFKVNGDGTYTFKAAQVTVFPDSGNNIMSSARNAATVVYMRRDFTLAKDGGATHGNLCYVAYDFTFDLGGHTLTLERSAYEVNPKKNSLTTNATFKNGTILVSTAPFMYFKATQQPDETIADQVFNITLEDITFKVAEGATSRYLGVEYRNNSDGKTRTYQANVTYNDCTFDYSAGVPSGGAVLFETGSKDGYATASVKVNGGKIILPTMNNVMLVNKGNDASTCVFEKGSDGNNPVIELQRNDTASADITINSGVTLDLNGKTLNMGSNYLKSDGDVVDNSTGKTGRLKVDTYTENEVVGVAAGTPKALLAENNTQMPVYISSESAYMLASMTAQAKQTKAEDLYSFNSISRPSFGATHVDKLQSGASAAKLQFILRLDWSADTDNDGTTEAYYQQFSYSDELVQDVYKNGKAFSVTVNGLTNYASSMKVSEYVKSDLGVVLENNSFSMVETASK